MSNIRINEIDSKMLNTACKCLWQNLLNKLLLNQKQFCFNIDDTDDQFAIFDEKR